MDDTTPVRLEVSSGTASFEVATNVPGIEVKGKTNNLTAHVEVASADGELVLQRLEAAIPVRTLSTGMKVRDEHMRKYIFTAPDGQMPNIAFSADKGTCKPGGSSHEFTCQVPGTLNIRGASRPVSLTIVAKQENGAAKAFHATVDTGIRLTDYSVEAPSQFGVRPSNDVKIHLEFTAKEKAAATAAGAEK